MHREKICAQFGTPSLCVREINCNVSTSALCARTCGGECRVSSLFPSADWVSFFRWRGKRDNRGLHFRHCKLAIFVELYEYKSPYALIFASFIVSGNRDVHQYIDLLFVLAVKSHRFVLLMKT